MLNESLSLTILATFVFTSFSLYAFISLQHRWELFQFIRPDGPESHLSKKRTPTAGGLCIVLGQLFFLLYLNQSLYIQVYCLSLTLFSLLGFCDDYLKISSKGLSSRAKFLGQCMITLVLLSMFTTAPPPLNAIFLKTLIPFYDTMTLPAIFLISLNFLTHISTSNATNLTDGQDGLLTQILLGIWLSFSLSLLIAQFSQAIEITQPLRALTLIAFANIATLSAFLLFNHYPAQIFMGDSGSLALGGALATTMMMINYPFGLLIIAIIPLIETISVMIQVLFFKIYRTRVFKMAPIHHHFELSGIHETTVTTRFVLVNTFFSLLAWIFYLKHLG